MTEYTPNFNLDLYESQDKANLRDQYNSAITKVDSELKTLSDGETNTSNLIANINREISNVNGSIENLQTDITKLNGLIDTNKTSIDTINGQISGISESANSAVEASNRAEQAVANQDAYWNALSVTNIDEAIDLKSDIDDAHTQSMVNQADISSIKQTNESLQNQITINKKQIDINAASISSINSEIVDLLVAVNNNAMNWVKVNITHPVNAFYSTLQLFVNESKTYFKLGGVIIFDYRNSSSRPSNSYLIPGTQQYGYRLFKILDEPPANNLIYHGCGVQAVGSITTPETLVGSAGAFIDLVLYVATDGYLYMQDYWRTGVSSDTSFTHLVYIQTPLSLKQLNIPEPPAIPTDI